MNVNVFTFFYKVQFKKVNMFLYRLSIKYYGKAAHASSYPWEGVNALDAAVACYNNISHLRQQMKPNWRVHGNIIIEIAEQCVKN